MKDYTKYYKARDKIQEIMKIDLFGPLSEEEIIYEEIPVNYYVCGKLYPKDFKVENTQNTSKSEDDTSDEYVSSSDGDILSLCNTYAPSSMGITFLLDKKCTKFNIVVDYAFYNQIDSLTAIEQLGLDLDEKNKKKHYYKRIPKHYKGEYVLNSTDNPLYIDDNICLKLYKHNSPKTDADCYTLTLCNNARIDGSFEEKAKAVIYQTSLKIISEEENAFHNFNNNVFINNNKVITEADLLYSDVDIYAQGHGCAVSYKKNDKGFVVSIQSEFIPEHEILQMKPSDKFQDKILVMKNNYDASLQEILEGINNLANMYQDWIKKQENLIGTYSEIFKTIALNNIEKCKTSCERIRRAAEVIKNNKDVEKAFRYANYAMYLQRKNATHQDDNDIKWYTFQLAFLLQEIYSMAYPESEEHDLVDLLWFPTGGGKTEAYLGIAAFTIFLRRLRYGDNSQGISVIMRYTLRLLSYQQFERASALICACEYTRQKENIPGEEISIGLWVGKDTTPNTLESAQKILDGNQGEGNPVQITKCPFCGTTITQDNYHVYEDKMVISCPDSSCFYHKGLPIKVIDEEIYIKPPTFIVSTVDKFAQLALNDKTGAILGHMDKDIRYMPPNLIIQDELHLISGPLGTITGLYEVAIKELCTDDKGVGPKIIASTATIKNADEQIKSLFASKYAQFPAQALDIKDSFFAEISSKNEKPARKYMGIMCVGTSQTTMYIRTIASLLYATRYIASCGEFDEKIADAYWTITSYFNTLRELGASITKILDDVSARFMYFQNKFAKTYPLIEQIKRKNYFKEKSYIELTSRVDSEKISEELHKLEKSYTTQENTSDAISFLLATNMISVGVDVDRLGTMVVVNQPKMTAEYIQATSRVGRKNPGLVITTYNHLNSRDRSHFEQFTQYHSSFYKHVESTSLTPFSDRSRARALQTIYVMLCRYLIPDLRKNNEASNYKRAIPALQKVRKIILSAVKNIDSDEFDNVKLELDEIEKEWEERKQNNSQLKYHEFIDSDDTLFDDDYVESSRFRVMNSMRSVEKTVKVYL